MKKILNILLSIAVIIFFISTFKFYSSNKNIDAKKYNRNNINEIISNKISNIPILKDDTNNVIKFNDGISNDNNNDKPRSFWNLLNTQ